MKTATGVLFLALMGLGASYWAPLRGPWMDTLASDVVGQKAGFSVGLLDVTVRHWTRLQFEMLNIPAADKKTILLASGPGQIHFGKLAYRKGQSQKIHIHLEDVALMEPLYRESPIFAWASHGAFQEPIFVTRLEAAIAEREDLLSAHLLKFQSNELLLQGGVQLAGGKVQKAHLMIFLPNQRFEKVPKELRARMMKRKDRWRGVRLIFHGNTLTAIGAAGPFFQLQWSQS